MSRVRHAALASTTVLAALAAAALWPDPAVARSSATQDEGSMSLVTATPDEGFALAITLARKAVTETQPDTEVLHATRPAYAHDPEALIAASHVVAVHFQTVAAANDYWRD